MLANRLPGMILAPEIIVPQAVAIVGTSKVPYLWTPERIKQATLALGVGREVQKVRTELTSTLTGQGGTGGTYAAATGLAATITPTTGNDVRIRGFINLSCAAAGCQVAIRMKRDSTVLLAGAAASNRTPALAMAMCDANQTACLPFDVLDTAPGNSAFVYSIEVVVDQNQTWSLNRTNTDTDASTFFRTASVIEAIEISR